jgi:PST family polysaccharide transporter
LSSSKKSILSSTSIIGGSSVVVIFLQMISAKAVALILGPTGTGLIGALRSSTQLIQTVSSLGINNSAVRDIAKANSKDNSEQLSITIKSLRKAVLFTGLIGLILTFSFAGFLSQFTFGSQEYTLEIRILSIAVFFNLIQGGQTALIQGMRRIKDLAKMSIFSALLVTLVSLPVLYIYELDGVVYFLLAMSIGQYLVSLYFARKIKIKDLKVSWQQAYEESKAMVKLGFSFMGGALAGVLGAYLIRVMIIRDLGLADAGIYQAAFAISGLYIGIILQAMGKDFYPRLTGVAFQPKEEIQLINEQTQVGMLLAAPGLMFTLALAPVGIKLLYSAEYLEAYPILQWMILGVFLRTISWPMGFLFMARAKGKVFFWTEIITWSLQIVLVYFGLQFFGLVGTGVAFFTLYIFYTIMMFILLNRENNFRWTNQVVKIILGMSLLFSLAFVILQFFVQLWGSIIVSFLGVGLSYLAYLEIAKILEVKSFKQLVDLIKNRKK